jgi:hypothetical protein
MCQRVLYNPYLTTESPFFLIHKGLRPQTDWPERSRRKQKRRRQVAYAFRFELILSRNRDTGGAEYASLSLTTRLAYKRRSAPFPSFLSFSNTTTSTRDETQVQPVRQSRRRCFRCCTRSVRLGSRRSARFYSFERKCNVKRTPTYRP